MAYCDKSASGRAHESQQTQRGSEGTVMTNNEQSSSQIQKRPWAALWSVLLLAPLAMAPKGCDSAVIGDECPPDKPCTAGSAGNEPVSTAGTAGKPSGSGGSAGKPTGTGGSGGDNTCGGL